LESFLSFYLIPSFGDLLKLSGVSPIKKSRAIDTYLSSFILKIDVLKNK
jgi:hypothetical protein